MTPNQTAPTEDEAATIIVDCTACIGAMRRIMIDGIRIQNMMLMQYPTLLFISADIIPEKSWSKFGVQTAIFMTVLCITLSEICIQAHRITRLRLDAAVARLGAPELKEFRIFERTGRTMSWALGLTALLSAQGVFDIVAERHSIAARWQNYSALRDLFSWGVCPWLAVAWIRNRDLRRFQAMHNSTMPLVIEAVHSSQLQ